MNQQKIELFFQRLQKENPQPKTELNYQSTFELLIAVMLSAQSTDKGVNKATEKLFAVANTPEKIFKLGEVGLKKYIQTIGLYNSKAHHIILTCEILIRKFQSQVPDQRADLEALPGVGRKTANVILNTAFHQPVMAVDTHIFRVSNRTGLAKGKTVRLVEDKLIKRIPKQYLLNAHHWLILHGRYVCKAKNPHCSSCLVSDLCDHPLIND